MNRKIIDDNRSAWEYRVHEWRTDHFGAPQELAKKIMSNPNSYLRYHQNVFKNISDKKIGSVCGSDGQRGVALSLLGAQVTIFDISEMQKKYALELARCASVDIKYEVGDFCSIDLSDYNDCFDYIYCEGGILHYFHNLNLFFSRINGILKKGGRLVLCDYHPFQKILSKEYPARNVAATGGNYFDDKIHEGHVPYKKFFGSEDQENFPNCWLRFYTVSEIINSIVKSELIVEEMQEHPKRDMPDWPGEFTLIVRK